MPESVQDRPTKAHEYVFLLTKAARYFYDADAIREPLAPNTYTVFGRMRHLPGGDDSVKSHNWGRDISVRKPKLNGDGSIAGANKRSVWTIASQAFPDAHFATFPEALVEPCILAGTSEVGCCPECGVPWERIKEAIGQEKVRNGKQPNRKVLETWGKAGSSSSFVTNHKRVMATTGWRPTCDHNLAPIPCTTLDPFSGSGTVSVVARRFGRRSVYVDLNPNYAEMAIERLAAIPLPFTTLTSSVQMEECSSGR
jgi:hypothetical protein